MTAGFRVVIPARYGATRLPAKPLRTVADRPLLEHVYRRACESGADEVLVATDDFRIRDVAVGFGATAYMTRASHRSGTDRIAELAELLGWDSEAVVVNLQGDEPCMPAGLIRQVAEDLLAHPDAGIATLRHRIHDAAEVFDPNAVKVVTDAQGYALYFSRAPIPWLRGTFEQRPAALPEAPAYYRHIGLYAYRAGFLKRYAALPPSAVEQAESLEQLRALDQGVRIHVSDAAEPPPRGVDTETDLAEADIRLRAAVDQALPSSDR